MKKQAQANMEVSVTVRGELVSAGNIKILHGGEIIGVVSGKEVVVEGVVKGKVLGKEKVEVAPQGKVEGDVETVALTVSRGAHYRGRCRVGQVLEDEQEEKVESAVLPKAAESVGRRWFWQK
ncbi:MAG: polymer-forming cytoskeletal protein [Verrucomicrobiia bacterium]